MAKGMGNILIIVIVGVVAYFAWKKGYFNKILGTSGGIGQPGQAGGVGVSGADGADANGSDMAGDVDAMVNGLLHNSPGTGAHTTVCNNGKCQHFSGDNVAVSCIDGVCRSNAAYHVNFNMM